MKKLVTTIHVCILKGTLYYMVVIQNLYTVFSWKIWGGLLQNYIQSLWITLCKLTEQKCLYAVDYSELVLLYAMNCFTIWENKANSHGIFLTVSA